MAGLNHNYSFLQALENKLNTSKNAFREDQVRDLYR